MCKPDLAPQIRDVVVAGAGPAGLLLASLLLRRNVTTAEDGGGIKYRVTLVDAGQDYGKLDPKTELTAHRSWMIGLAGHGLEALRTIPELYDGYVSDVGVRLTSFSMHLGAKEFKSKAGEDGEDNEGYIVDRNYICAAIARYLRDEHGNDPYFRPTYDTKILYVDGDHRRVLVRSSSSSADGSEGSINERYIPYDLLAGCDGIRSRVREAILTKHRDFECDVGDIFQTFKAVHVKCPDSVDPASMHVLPGCFPLMQGIALPEKGNMLNISVGGPRHKFADLPEELKSDDPQVVARYVKDNFKAFELVDYDDFARQWVAQKWNRTGQVHCNFYHSLPHRAVIMGDAAHATSPSIGMGMNTALRDAAAFARLLDEHDDDVKLTLPAFSEERVKEGNSLTDLAMHLYCLDDRAQMIEVLHSIVRGVLSKLVPFGLVDEHPQQIIGRPGVNLSDVYDLATRQGIIKKHRYINDKTRRDFFEAECGMVKQAGRRGLGIKSAVLALSVVVAVVAVGASRVGL